MATSTPIDIFTTESQLDSYQEILSKKYLGNSVVVLSGTNTGYVTGGVDAYAPYSNLSNRYFPTVAGLPSEGSNLKTAAQIGNYFLPSNLGASIYLTKSIVYSFDPTQIQEGQSYIIPNPVRFNKGRGLTLNDQSNVVTHSIDNDWMKETRSSYVYNGNIIGADTFQKFLPYQSAYETTKTDSNGVVSVKDDFEFWGGIYKDIWCTCIPSNAFTFQKYFDLAGRIDTQLLTPNQELFAWNTDIYGNQYALYKQLSGVDSIYESNHLPGTLWVKAGNNISLGVSALSAVFERYENDATVFDMFASNIINFEVFLDTLVIELSGAVLFEQIEYDYTNSTIDRASRSFLPLYTGDTTTSALSTTNLSDYGSAGSTAVTYYGGSWYDYDNRTITMCTLLSATIEGSGGLSALLVPVLYQIDFDKSGGYSRIHPTNTTDFSEYIHNSIVSYVEAPVITYNKDIRSYCVTLLAFVAQNVFVVSYKIAT